MNHVFGSAATIGALGDSYGVVALYYMPAYTQCRGTVAGVCRRRLYTAGGRARGRSTLHGAPVVLRPVRATPCSLTVCVNTTAKFTRTKLLTEAVSKNQKVLQSEVISSFCSKAVARNY